MVMDRCPKIFSVYLVNYRGMGLIQKSFLRNDVLKVGRVAKSRERKNVVATPGFETRAIHSGAPGPQYRS